MAAIGLVAVIVAGGFFLNTLRNRVEVIEAARHSPSEVGLGVNSCNQNPTAEVEEVEPGTYEVLVRTELPSTGNDCADAVTIGVDPDQPTITIIDRTSGETFELLGTGEEGPAGLNGVWQMTTVAIGEVVDVGVTTAELPEVRILEDDGSGVIAGNFGCNEVSIEVEFDGDTITGRPDTLEGTEELCTIPDGGDQLVLTERTLLELLSGDPVEYTLEGDDLEIGNLDTNAVFVRVGAAPR